MGETQGPSGKCRAPSGLASQPLGFSLAFLIGGIFIARGLNPAVKKDKK